MVDEESLTSAELKIYQLLEHHQKPGSKKDLTIEEISRKTKLFRSRIHHYISSMRMKGIDIVGMQGKYFLGPRSAKIAPQLKEGPKFQKNR